MSVVRLNIALPEILVLKLNKLAGPRKKSDFIAEAVKKRINELEASLLSKELEEGYLAEKRESADITRDFETADLGGWDDY